MLRLELIVTVVLSLQAPCAFSLRTVTSTALSGYGLYILGNFQNEVACRRFI